MNNRLIKSNDAGGGGACTNTVDLYNPFPDGGGVALYQLNGDATDVSGNYDGSPSNVTYGAGQFGQAGVFNGTSSYINIDAINLPLNDFTVSAWANTNNATPYGMIVSTFKNGQGQMYFTFYQNQLVYADLYSSGSQTLSSPSGSIQNNTWYHCVITKSSTNGIKLYLNGSLVDSNASTTNLKTNSNGQNRIGHYFSPNPLDYFNGEIDQFRIFNRALRPYEVEALYTEEYCTPTIVPSEHFNTVTWTGDGASTRSFTGVGFQPDFVWTKKRSLADSHHLFDSVRGLPLELRSDTTGAELTSSYGSITSFDIDGFTTTAGANGNDNQNELNETVVAWNFKAGGAAVTNTDGSITSQVSANTEAGFSVVSYTGTGNTVSFGHGLGKEPDCVIIKNRDRVIDWTVYFKVLGSSLKLRLSQTSAAAATGNYANTNPTNNVFTVSANDETGFLNENYIAYCFAEVEGFSSFGSYVGTGASGNTIVTGFEPAFIMVKRTDSTGSWEMIDNKRSPENVRDTVLFANLSNAEQQGDTLGYYPTNFLENGFELLQGSNGYNASGASYIYMAFAADPTTVEPTLEDSFNTVTYTGNGGTQSVTGVGFQPDFTWLKARNNAYNHMLQDSVRGNYRFLTSAVTNAENTNSNRDWFKSFDSDGFTVSYLSSDSTPTTEWNNSGEPYVAWNWKGAELPAINSNGSIPSVVSANPAAGFSIVSYTGNDLNGQTVGHGLNSTPDFVIVKNRDSARNWHVYHSAVMTGGDAKFLRLNTTDAILTDGQDNVWESGFNNQTFGIGAANSQPNNSMIAYCFAEVAGFSKFGSYAGGNLDTKVTGFEPAFVMVKNVTGAGDWYMYDNKRDTTNPIDKTLRANDSLEEQTAASKFQINFETNGFSFVTNTGGSVNVSGQTYIYMAFANQF
jgi:hypothetical protein